MIGYTQQGERCGGLKGQAKHSLTNETATLENKTITEATADQ